MVLPQRKCDGQIESIEKFKQEAMTLAGDVPSYLSYVGCFGRNYHTGDKMDGVPQDYQVRVLCECQYGQVCSHWIG